MFKRKIHTRIREYLDHIEFLEETVEDYPYTSCTLNIIVKNYKDRIRRLKRKFKIK